MDLIAKRPVFGDFGRLKKGDIVKSVSKPQAEKLIKAGGYAEATADEIKAAEAKKTAPSARAQTKTRRASTGARDEAAFDAAIADVISELRQEFEGAVKVVADEMKSVGEQVTALRSQIEAAERRHAEEIARLSAGAAEAKKSAPQDGGDGSKSGKQQ